MKQRLLLTLTLAFVLSQTSSQAEWMDDISLSGDLRLRYDWIDKDGSEKRDRVRLRARIGLDAKVNDVLQARFRLASGSDEPTSSNQTLDDGFSTKDLGLDRGYLVWSPPALSDTQILGGKMKNPFIRVSNIIWDGDVNPEGFAFSTAKGEDLQLFINGAGFIVDERKAESETYLHALQIASRCEQGAIKGTLGASYYSFDNIQGTEPIFDPTNPLGNSVIEAEDGSLTYAEKFGELELFATAEFTALVPVKLFIDYVINTEAEGSEDTAWIAGVSLGKLTDPGTWTTAYNYRNIEADALIGAMSDSDSIAGQTDAEGHTVKIKNQLAENWTIALALFSSKLGLQAESVDHDRVMIDLVASF